MWGAYNGFFLVIERLFLSKYLSKWISIGYTFFVATIGWVLFRNTDMSVSSMLYKKMFSWNVFSASPIDLRFKIVLPIALFIAFSGLIKPFYTATQNDELLFFEKKWRLTSLFFMAIVLFVLSSSYLLGQDFNPFIYFRF